MEDAKMEERAQTPLAEALSEVGSRVVTPSSPPPGVYRIAAVEYLAHVALAYAASPAETAEESIAKGLLEIASVRIGVEPGEAMRAALDGLGAHRLEAPWSTGCGVSRLECAVLALSAEQQETMARLIQEPGALALVLDAVGRRIRSEP